MDRTSGTGNGGIPFSYVVYTHGLYNCTATWPWRDLTEMSKNLVWTEGNTSGDYS